ncbi:MAG: hypothetical protein ACRDRS_00415 [Pseudonocardiaceae bacterium]
MHESYVKLVERWVSLYCAIDQFGRVIDMVEATTDKVAAYPLVREELAPGPSATPRPTPTNRIEADHGRLTWPRPIRGVKQLCRERVATVGNAFIQSVAAATTNSTSKEPSIPQVMIKKHLRGS